MFNIGDYIVPIILLAAGGFIGFLIHMAKTRPDSFQKKIEAPLDAKLGQLSALLRTYGLESAAKEVDKAQAVNLGQVMLSNEQITQIVEGVAAKLKQQ